MLLIAVGTLVVGHVFDHRYCRYFQQVKHFDALDHIYIRQFLRRSHYHCRFQRHFLAQSDLYIASARREINHQVI